MEMPNWVFEGLAPKPNCTCEVLATLDLVTRKVTPRFRFTLTKEMPWLDGTTKPAITQLDVTMDSFSVVTENYCYKLEPVSDPGCVITLAELARRDDTLGQSGDFVDMKQMIDRGITRMIDRNTKKVIRLTNQDFRPLEKTDLWAKIWFGLDGGHTGNTEKILAVQRQTSKEYPIMLEGFPWDLTEFFSIPILENQD